MAFEKMLNKDVNPAEIFTEKALNYMAEKFSTPLQINHYAWSSLMKAHQIGQKPVDIEVLNDVILKDLDGIEATLRRYGYDIKALSEAVDARPSEIRTYFKGRLSSGRATEIQKEILMLGIVGL